VKQISLIAADAPRTEPARAACRPYQVTLNQYFTPGYATEALVHRHFSQLGASDLVIEPACGDGGFLAALPLHVPAIGVEIDPVIAALARANTGRTVITGDFRSAVLPDRAAAVIGNPPFNAKLISQFLDRSWSLLDEGGVAGFILPAYVLQTSTAVNRFHRRWSIEQELLPRNLFPRLKLPIVFSIFRKERVRRLVGFFLYAEAADIAAMHRDCRRIAEQSGKPQTWRAVTLYALRSLGGDATLDALYRAIEPRRPSLANRYWEARIRNVLQTCDDFEPVCRGRWRVAAATAAAAAG
jgi:adenine-specific DNA-methyltransferase